MNFRSSANRRRVEASLEMTPLIDVVFLLLVFFLLTTTFAQPTPTDQANEDTEAVIEVDLPSSGSGNDTTTVERLTLFLDAQGQIYANESTPMAPNQVKQLLLDMKAEGKEPLVDLKADKRVRYGAAIELLDLVRETGIETVNFVIQKSE